MNLFYESIPVDMIKEMKSAGFKPSKVAGEFHKELKR